MGTEMDRQIVYPGSIPLETDLLNTNKYAMMGMAKLAAAMMGSNTYLHGLACTPSSPASMVVNIAKGQIYSLQNVDGTAYSSLPADTTNTILKQGAILTPTTFTLAAPVTVGQSINYLIQVTYSDIDSGATVLPYYNAANPSVAYSGPNNSGTAQNTVRSGICAVSLKSGVAATTGTQTTPAADTGYTAAWVITVPQGATTITAANIAVAANAPFLPAAGVFSAIQQGTMTYAIDTGAANAYVASYLPNLPALTDGMRLTFKARAANTGNSTLAVNGSAAFPLYSNAHQALQGGEIIANGLIEAEWNSSLSAWVMCGNSGGALPVSAASQSNHAVNLGELNSAIAALGSIYQPLNQNLIALAGLASATDTLPYFFGQNKAALAPFTSFGRDVVGQNSTADLFKYLGIGSAANKNAGNGSGQLPDMSFFDSNFGFNGYQKLPSGLIIQWGSAPATIGTLSTKAYPIQFPNAALHVVLTHNVANDANGIGISGADVSSSNTSQFTYKPQGIQISGNSVSAASAGSGAITFHFLAIGY